MTMGMALGAGDNAQVPTPNGAWADPSQYGLGMSPGPAPYPGQPGTLVLNTPMGHPARPPIAPLGGAGQIDSTSSGETSASAISASLNSNSRPMSVGPPANATSYFPQLVYGDEQKSDRILTASPAPSFRGSRLNSLSSSVKHAPYSRSPSPTCSVTPAQLAPYDGSLSYPAPPYAPRYRESMDSNTSSTSLDPGGLRSATQSVHSSEGLEEDDGGLIPDDMMGDLDGECEGTERNGMMWGMKTADYKSLSARERKRVRNRISARTFRARRKEHMTSLESTLSNKDTMIRRLQEENVQREWIGHSVHRGLSSFRATVKERLAQYEKGHGEKPYARSGLSTSHKHRQ